MLDLRAWPRDVVNKLAGAKLNSHALSFYGVSSARYGPTFHQARLCRSRQAALEGQASWARKAIANKKPARFEREDRNLHRLGGYVAHNDKGTAFIMTRYSCHCLRILARIGPTSGICFNLGVAPGLQVVLGQRRIALGQ
jgi:hypothetical protein